MEVIIPVFQFEIRFNHILNFSEIARNLLAPYVRLTQSIKIDKQNTLEETYTLNFEDDEYLIIVSWDRIVFRGQGSLDTYTQKNSPIDILFFDIFNQIYELKEFGNIRRSWFFGMIISKPKTKSPVLDSFAKSTLVFNPNEIVKDFDDIAVVIESTTESESKSATFGPYWGPDDILKRPIKPINIVSLGDLDFEGIMLDYKRILLASEINFDTFIEHCSEFNDTFKKIWKNQ